MFSPPIFSPPPYPINFMFSFSFQKKIRKTKIKTIPIKIQKPKLTSMTNKKCFDQQKMSQNKTKNIHTHLPSTRKCSLFCVGQLLLGIGPGLECVINIPNLTPLKKTDFPFASGYQLLGWGETLGALALMVLGTHLA